jgi:hypothetical protein
MRGQPQGPTQPGADRPPPSTPLLDVPRDWPKDPVEQERAIKHIEANLSTLRDQQDFALDQQILPQIQAHAHQSAMEMQAQMMVAPPRTPEMFMGYQQQLSNMKPYLRPEVAQSVGDTLSRNWDLRQQRSQFDQQIDQHINQNYWQYLPETKRRMQQPPQDPYSGGIPFETPTPQIQNPNTGEWGPATGNMGSALVSGVNPFGEPTFRGRLVSDLQSLADKNAEERYGPSDEARGAGAAAPNTQQMFEKANKARIEGDKSVSRDTYKAMQSDAIEGAIQRRLGSKKGDIESSEDFAGNMANVASFMVPFGAAEKLSVAAVRSMPGLIGAAGDLTKAGKILGHVVGPSAAMAAYGAGRPLGAREQLEVDSEEQPERKRDKEIAFRFMRATQEGLLTPLYSLVGKIGGSEGSSMIRKLFGSTGAAAAAPLISELGSAADDKIAQILSNGTQTPAQEIRDVFAQQGSYGNLSKALKATTSKERFAALKDYVSDVIPGSLVFGALTMYHHLGQTFDSRVEGVRAMEDSVAELAANPHIPRGAREQVVARLRDMVSQMMPDRKEDERRTAEQRMQDALGPGTSARATLDAQSMVERHLGDIDGTTVAEKLATVRQKLTALRDKPEDDPEVIALGHEATALTYLRDAPGDRNPARGFRKAMEYMDRATAARGGTPESTTSIAPEQAGAEAVATSQHVGDNAGRLGDAAMGAQLDPAARVVGVDEHSGTRLVRTESGKLRSEPVEADELHRFEGEGGPPAREAEPAPGTIAVGDQVDTKKGPAEVVATHPERGAVTVKAEDGATREVPVPAAKIEQELPAAQAKPKRRARPAQVSIPEQPARGTAGDEGRRAEADKQAHDLWSAIQHDPEHPEAHSWLRAMSPLIADVADARAAMRMREAVSRVENEGLSITDAIRDEARAPSPSVDPEVERRSDAAMHEPLSQRSGTGVPIRKPHPDEEQIAAAAVRYGGKTYEGKLHYYAWLKAAEEHGFKSVEEMVADKGGPSEGYMTTFGRFLTRDEADELLGGEGRQLDAWDDRLREHPIEQIEPDPAAIEAKEGAAEKGQYMRPMGEELARRPEPALGPPPVSVLNDPLMARARELVQTSGKAGVRMLQRELNVGNRRAKAMLEQLKAEGLVGEGGTNQYRMAPAGEQAVAQQRDQQRQEANAATQRRQLIEEAQAPVDRFLRAAKAVQEAGPGRPDDDPNLRERTAAWHNLQDQMGTADPKANERMALSSLAAALVDEPGKPSGDDLAFRFNLTRGQGERLAGLVTVQRELRAEMLSDTGELPTLEDKGDYEDYVARQKEQGRPAQTREQYFNSERKRVRQQALHAIELPEDELSPEVRDLAESGKVDEAIRNNYVETLHDPAVTQEQAQHLMDLHVGMADGAADALLEHLDEEGKEPLTHQEFYEEVTSLYDFLNSKEAKLARYTEAGKATLQKVRRVEAILRRGVVGYFPGGMSFMGGSGAGIAMLARATANGFRFGYRQIRRFVQWSIGQRGWWDKVVKEVARRDASLKKADAWMSAFASTMDPREAPKGMLAFINKWNAFGEPGLVMAYGHSSLHTAEGLRIVSMIDRGALPETADPADQEAFIRAMENWHRIGKGGTTPEEIAADEAWKKVEAMGPKVVELHHALRDFLGKFNTMAFEYQPEMLHAKDDIKLMERLRGQLYGERDALVDEKLSLEAQRAGTKGAVRQALTKQITKVTDRIRNRTKNISKAEARMDRWSDYMQQRRLDNAQRLEKGFFPSIPNVDLLSQVERDAAQKRSNANDNAYDIDFYRVAGHWLKRRGALEEAGIRDFNVVRSTFHYIREVMSVVEMNKWWHENRDRIAGTERAVDRSKISMPHENRFLWSPTLQYNARDMQRVRVLGRVWAVNMRLPSGTEHRVLVRSRDDLKGFEKFMVDKPAPMTALAPHRSQYRLNKNEPAPGFGRDEIAFGLPETLKTVTLPPEISSRTGTVMPGGSVHFDGALKGKLLEHLPGKYDRLREAKPERAAAFKAYVDKAMTRAMGDEVSAAWEAVANGWNRFLANQQLGNYNPAPAARNYIQGMISLMTHGNLRATVSTMHWGQRFTMAVNDVINSREIRDAMESVQFNLDKGGPAIFNERIRDAVSKEHPDFHKWPKLLQEDDVRFRKAAADLAMSPFAGGLYMEALGDVRHNWRPGQFSKLGVKIASMHGTIPEPETLTGHERPVMDRMPGVGRTPFVFFNWAARNMEAQTYLMKHVAGQLNSKPEAQVREEAERFTMAEHNFQNRAMNSELANNPFVRIFGTMAGWMTRRSIANWRYYVTHGAYTGQRMGGANPLTALGAHGLETLTRAAKTGFYMVMMQQIGQSLPKLFGSEGVDPTRSIGASVESIPLVGKDISYELRKLFARVGIDQDVSTPGMPQAAWRQDWGQRIREAEWLPTVLKNVLTDERGHFQLGTFEGGIPLDIFVGNWTPYSYETFKDAFDWMSQAWSENSKAAESARGRFVMSILGGSWQRALSNLFADPDPDDPTRVLKRDPFTGVVLEHAKSMGAGGPMAAISRYIFSWFGPSIESGYQWQNRSVADAKRVEFEKGQRGSAAWNATQALMEYLKYPGTERSQEAMQRASSTLQDYVKETGRHWSGGQVKAQFKEWYDAAKANLSLSSSERDVLHADTGTEKIGHLIEVLDNPTVQISEKQFGRILENMNLKQAAMGADAKTLQRFAESYKAAKERWAAQASRSVPSGQGR